ncbi:hydroxymethylglutaryl-CoA lyase [Lichenibacterium dinghuense]|uniref:hydroxymethylglutaryl-CoA lyase n=1 Tax=Lichenibacterium dinghuense TaxID=2895977 RepID=UPI001F24C353|nr:hydroxymethylglutaryl-CoA lyase [Lichenibacterium sp. 6Y81]
MSAEDHAGAVLVREVGPRDGLQMAHGIMPTDLKIRWIRALAEAGLRSIEVGSFVPPKLIPQMADTGEVVAAVRDLPGLAVTALVPNLKGAQRAYRAGAARIVVPVSVSESHSRANTNKGTDEAVAELGRIAAWARAEAPGLHVEAGCATAFGCSIEGAVSEARVVRVAESLVAAGAASLVLADTVGYGNPAQVRRLVAAVRSAVGDRLEALHLHDTMGLGLANAYAGLESGIRQFDASLAGLGGCPYAPGASGNIVTEDLVFMLESAGFSTGVDLNRLLAARGFLAGGLPDEPLHGGVSRAGLPKTYATPHCPY